MHRSPGLRCVSPCYRNRAVCLPRRKIILRSTIYRAICLPQRKIVTIYRSICLPRREIVTIYRAICLPRIKTVTIYRAICLPQFWDTVKNRGVGNRTIRYRRLRYHIPYHLKNRGTPKPYHLLPLSKALPCRALKKIACMKVSFCTTHRTVYPGFARTPTYVGSLTLLSPYLSFCEFFHTVQTLPRAFMTSVKILSSVTHFKPYSESCKFCKNTLGRIRVGLQHYYPYLSFCGFCNTSATLAELL